MRSFLGSMGQRDVTFEGRVAMPFIGDEQYGVASVLRMYAKHATSRYVFIAERGGPLADELRDVGAEVVSMQLRPAATTLRRRSGLLADAIHQVIAQKDIVLIHAHWMPHWLALWRLRRRGYETVFHVHTAMTRGTLGRASPAVYRALKETGATGVIAVSQFIASQWGGARVAVVHNAADTSSSSASEAGRRAPDGILRCLSAGRLTEDKGHHVAVAAVAKARLDGAEVSLVIAGDSNDVAYKSRLRSEIERRGLNGAVVLAGYADLRRLHLQTDVAIHCRLSAEPCSVWICEALADGVPVVATSAGGNSELLGEPPAGSLYAPGDSGELAELLVAACNDRSTLARWRSEAESRREYFSPSRFIAETAEAYASFLPP